ncbi:MAG TPA: hypothetical protein VF060_12190 [Trebonia sp.]
MAWGFVAAISTELTPHLDDGPGFALVDPIVAILLGVCMFGERLQTAPADLAGEVVGLLVLAAGAAALSHSDLIGSHPAAGASGTPRRDRSPMELMRKSR